MVRARVMELGGTPLACRRAHADSTVVDCRSRLPAHGRLPVLHIWLSAIGGQTGILTLAGRFDSAGLTRWQLALSGAYGNVPVTTQGSQRMMQWVRQGRMIRLTWRSDATGASASLSLVDGRILDSWGRRRNENGTGVAGDSAAR
ncbi:MAG: hypothetical protein ACREL6_04135 [Gemmatimonadales bacterium]